MQLPEKGYQFLVYSSAHFPETAIRGWVVALKCDSRHPFSTDLQLLYLNLYPTAVY